MNRGKHELKAHTPTRTVKQSKLLHEAWQRCHCATPKAGAVLQPPATASVGN
jgi:hypothetical protein